MKKVIQYLSGVVLIISVWYGLSAYFTVGIVPYPHDVFIKLGELLGQWSTYADLGATIFRTLTGAFFAILIGVGLGIVTGSFKLCERVLFIPVSLLQGAPPLLWVIPLMLMLGTGGASPAAVVFFVILPLVIINIQEGMKTIKPSQWDMFRIYANSRTLKLYELVIPSLSPYLKSILILGTILGLKSAVIGEWFGAKSGIGRRINELFYSFDMVSFYAVSLLFLIVVTIFAFVFQMLGDKIFSVRKKSVIISSSGYLRAGYFRKSGSSLSISKVSFSYENRPVLRSASIDIAPGEVAVLTGNSGCGKTTLAKISTGILRPSGGSTTIPRNPGFIFQDDALLQHLDCFGNASLPAMCRKEPDYEQTVLHFLNICGLSDSIYLFPDEMSGGMKKRLAFARALVLNPDFMVLDEPFNNLHKEARIDLWNLYFELFVSRKIPSLIITHYPEELSGREVNHYRIDNGAVLKR